MHQEFGPDRLLECYKQELFPNQGLILTNRDNPSQSLLAMVKVKNDKFFVNRVIPPTISGFKPSHVGQAFVAAFIADPDIDIVTVSGDPGTGKGYSVLAACKPLLEQESPLQKKMIVTRYTVSSGPAQGFLPGDLIQKTEPWLGLTEEVL